MKRVSRFFIALVSLVLFCAYLTEAAKPEPDSKTKSSADQVSKKQPATDKAKSQQTPQNSADKPRDIQVQTTPPPSLEGSVTVQEIEQVVSSSAGEQIKWWVISGGGTTGTSASYKLDGTVGQTSIGNSTSTSNKLNAGFWQTFSTSCCAKEGDFNHNNTVNVVDVTACVSYLFQGGLVYGCKQEADVDDNNTVNVVDLTRIVGYLFQGGSVGVCP